MREHEINRPRNKNLFDQNRHELSPFHIANVYISMQPFVTIKPYDDILTHTAKTE